MTALDAFADKPRWNAWRNELRNDNVTKVPYAPQGGKARADDPSTWGTRAAAEARAVKIVNGAGGGIGIQLGDLDGDKFLGGIDLDSCLANGGTIAPWAAPILSAVPTYAEKSPSGRGVKLLFYIAAEAVRPFLHRIGVEPNRWGCRRAAPGEDARNHGPAVELYLARHYFTVTGDKLPDAPDDVATLDGAQLDRLTALIPPAKSSGSSIGGGADHSRSARAFRIGVAMYRAGKSFEEFCEAVRADPDTASWYVEKGVSGDGRELRRIWEKAGTEGHGLDLVRVSDIVARPVRWLWPDRIARGKVTMVAGHPGTGKSQLALWIAAIVTTGGLFPVSGERAEPGSVIILSAEDDPEDTIRPRLEAAGADLTRCRILRAVRERKNDGTEHMRGFSLDRDLPRLETALATIGGVTLVIIDPITAYLGDTDSYRNAGVRALLTPLGELAAKHAVTVFAISHLRKSIAGDAVLQVTDSLAFAAAARGVYIVARDPNDMSRRLFLPAKNNLGNDRTGYAYRIESASLPGGIETSRIVWGPDVVTMTADEALAPRDVSVQPGKLDTAAEWLREVLADGPVAVAKVRAEADAAGFAWMTVRRARDELEVITGKMGFDVGWAWRLPRKAAGDEGEE
jgi:putative DNA primase/helicase